MNLLENNCKDELCDYFLVFNKSSSNASLLIINQNTCSTYVELYILLHKYSLPLCINMQSEIY